MRKHVNAFLFSKAGYTIADFKIEQESQEYLACTFKVNNKTIMCRTAKITPKKTGQFVTFWKRNSEGVTIPYQHTDEFHFYLIHVKANGKSGLFLFPKTVLVKKGIITTHLKVGKRGFRVYPSGDAPTSKQAFNTQKWQSLYFIENIVENSAMQLHNLLQA
ncbi:MepB family protein [Croceivirga sp. JEA036]|uniref:MepB family protein n=1 Tax=Croceivirga sp. JEA036 TaxID=2721162 RepID=UPI00143922BE|nr:MepB family protein [Croceivirga sp. JEA036]NJB37578.1 MepB family protein [Croceivirga sp. JEA036]